MMFSVLILKSMHKTLKIENTSLKMNFYELQNMSKTYVM